MSTDRPSTAYDSLRGLSVGDALGEQVMWQGLLRGIRRGRLPSPPWRWTDDTALAVAQVRELQRHGSIKGQSLAVRMADTYRADPDRGFGAGMHRLFPRLLDGAPWEQAAASLFDGQGSFGNGAAMRMGPLGAWFAAQPDQQTQDPSLDQVIGQATIASRVTHAHPEGIAGGVAVAVAAALAARSRGSDAPDARDLIGTVRTHCPPGEVNQGLDRARRLGPIDAGDAAAVLGNGSQVTAMDTVPFTVWCAAHHLDDYEQAIRATASVGGDVDTTCAIVGGIVAARCGVHAIPASWLDAAEDLPSDVR